MDPTQQTQSLDPTVVALTKSIGHVESGGDYTAKGKSGEFGAYQFMPQTWKAWAGQYLGDPNAQPSRENQDKVAYSKVYDLGKQGYKPAQIASIWNSGKAYWQGNVGTNKYGAQFDTPGYVNKVAQKFSELTGTKAAQAYQQPDQPTQPEGKSVLGFVGNVLSSGANLISGIGHAIAHPIDTASGIANLGAGALETGIQKGADALGIQNNHVVSPEMQQFGNAVNFYKDRYGGAQNIKDTLYNDPVGAAADASVLLGGAGAALGKVGEAGELSALTRVGGAISKAGELVDPLKAVGEGIGAVKSGIGKGATAVGDALTPIDEGVVNTLKPQNVNPEMSLAEQATMKQKNLTDLNKYMDQAKKSVSNYSEDNALKIASQKAEEAVSQMDKQLKLYGKTKDMALQRIASKPVDISGLQDSFASIVEQRTGAKFTQKGVITTPRGQFSTITSATDKGLLTDTYSILKKLGDNPTALRTDRAVDALQARLDYASKNLYEPVNSQVEGMVKDTVKELNKRVQSLDSNYRLANKGYSDTIQTRNELNKALGLHANKGASLLKRVFSLTDGGTKALFDQVKTKTGIDLIREATLAKFAMESVGDYRQANLLEQLLNSGKIPTSPAGLIHKAGEFILDKTIERNPGNKAIRLLGGKPAEPAIGRIRRSLQLTGESTPLGVVSRTLESSQ